MKNRIFSDPIATATIIAMIRLKPGLKCSEVNVLLKELNWSTLHVVHDIQKTQMNAMCNVYQATEQFT